jgi:hypothetical protein
MKYRRPHNYGARVQARRASEANQLLGSDARNRLPCIVHKSGQFSAFFDNIASRCRRKACATRASDSQPNIDIIKFAESRLWQKS